MYYNIDAWGNLNSVNATDGSGNSIAGGAGMGVPSPAGTNNQLGGLKYDLAGNVTFDGINSYQYDEESRVAATTVSSAIFSSAILPSMYYLYNGDGERVAKLNASQEASLNGPMDETCPIVWGPVPISPYPIFLGNQALTPATGSNGSAAWVPSVGGLVGIRTLLDAKLYWGAGLAESDVCGNPTKEYIYLNGKRIAYQDWTDATGGVYYYFADDLGSASVVTDDQGDVIDESDYYPYGGENMLASGSGQAYKFTGKERDDESGNDFFGARYYSSNMGRWMSPDWDAKPAAVPYADFADPQTLNLYGYVSNNPLSRADPNGHLMMSLEEVASWGGAGSGGANPSAGGGIWDTTTTGGVGAPTPSSTPAQNNAPQATPATAQQQNLPNAPTPSGNHNLDDTATAALKATNPKSIREDREYVGRVYKNPDGTYTATAMTPIGQAGGNLPPISSLPAGTT